jgi:hypothetical protein
MLAVQLAQHRRQHTGEEDKASAETYASEPALASPAHRVHRIIHIAIDATCVLDQFRAGGCRVCTLAKPLDEQNAKPPLQLAHLEADGGLREIQASRSCGKAPEPHHLGHRAELVQVQAAHLKKIFIDLIKTIELTDYRPDGIVAQRRGMDVLSSGTMIKLLGRLI